MKFVSLFLILSMFCAMPMVRGQETPAAEGKPASRLQRPVVFAQPQVKTSQPKGTLAKADALQRYQPIPLQKGQIIYLTVDEGEFLRIPLVENGTTGYLWNVAISNEKVLPLIYSDFLLPKTNGMAGVPGVRVFSFKARNCGSAVLSFYHIRSWEKNDEGPFAQIVVLVVDDD